MNWRFLLPQRWPMWAALALLRALAHRDYSSLLRFGARLGDLARRLPLPQRRVVRRNLELCFPGMAPADRERLLAQHFRESGITLGETALAWFAPPEQLRKLVRFEGRELHTFELTQQLVLRTRAPVGRMVSARYPLERFREALSAATHRGRSGAIKVLLTPR